MDETETDLRKANRGNGSRKMMMLYGGMPRKDFVPYISLPGKGQPSDLVVATKMPFSQGPSPKQH